MKKFAILISVLVIFLTGCSPLKSRLAKKMIEKYSEDQNYATLPGEVIKSTKIILLLNVKN